MCYNLVKNEENFMDIDEFINSTEKRIVFLTGAGLSKESGIPTFRDSDDGLWEKISIDKVCNISTFDVNYKLVHEFYNTMRMNLENVQPNAGHEFIAHIQKKYPNQVMHITANVDDLSERAGGTAMHVHGNIKQIVENWCSKDYNVIDIGYEPYEPRDGCYAKPNIVMFGESFRYEGQEKKELYTEMYAVLDSMNENDMIIVIGSSDTVIPWSHIIQNKLSTKININPTKSSNPTAFEYDINKPVTETTEELLEFITQFME